VAHSIQQKESATAVSLTRFLCSTQLSICLWKTLPLLESTSQPDGYEIYLQNLSSSL